jgi:hypothetical protein
MDSVIRIMLADESNAEGTKKAILNSRNLKTFIIPREEISEAVAKHQDLNNTGVYFLFGVEELEDGNEERIVYVGQTTESNTRLLSHRANKDYWDTAIAFTTNDNTLDVAHARYLEGYAYKQIQKAGRYRIKNGNKPEYKNPNEWLVAEANDYFYIMQKILTTLGYPVFEEIVRQSHDVFYFKSTHSHKGGVYAEGSYESSGGFVVYKDSTAVLETEHTGLSGKIENKKKRLIEDKTLRQEGRCYIFTRDVVFDNCKHALGVVIGYTNKAKEKWRHKKLESTMEEFEQRIACELKSREEEVIEKIK